jgi:hypothetical protein
MPFTEHALIYYVSFAVHKSLAHCSNSSVLFGDEAENSNSNSKFLKKQVE